MGASFGSNTHRFQCVAPLGAPSRRRYGAGPRFLRSVSSRLRPSSTAPFGQPHRRASGRPNSPPSASSSRGVIVPPGGTPAPPECVGRVIPTPAGAASDPTFITPHESALGGSDAAIINPPRRARISFRSSFVWVCRRGHSVTLLLAPGAERFLEGAHACLLYTSP